MISYRRKCIFVHIPKAAGTSVENLIWPLTWARTKRHLWMGFIDEYNNPYQTGGLQHLTASQIQHAVGPEIFQSFFKFTFVRNPYDKAISQYLYMSKRHDLRSYIGMKADASFKDYLGNIVKKQHVQWMPQHKFFLDHNGETVVDYIGHVETFDSDMLKIAARIKMRLSIFGIDLRKIPHSNKSARESYRSYYDEESREIVAQLYKEDLELLGYTY